METVLSSLFATARSNVPSPLKSAATTADGSRPVPKSARLYKYVCAEAVELSRPSGPINARATAMRTPCAMSCFFDFITFLTFLLGQVPGPDARGTVRGLPLEPYG